MVSAVRRNVSNYISYVPPQDATHVLRLVGFTEYSIAVDYLDRFLSTATPIEIRIAEEIVAERPEFTVHSNISRKWEGSSSFLSESAKDSKFAPISLKRVTALARVEIGAALAGFTSVPAPFAVKGPTVYDSTEYAEIILDGYRSLYWTIAADPNLNNYSQVAIPKNLLLIEMRRVGLAHLFGSAAAELMKPKLTAVQIAEIQSWQQRLEQLNVVLTYCLIKFVGIRQSRAKVSDLQIPSCAMYNGDAEKLTKFSQEERRKSREMQKYNTVDMLKLQLEARYWQVLSLVKCE